MNDTKLPLREISTTLQLLGDRLGVSEITDDERRAIRTAAKVLADNAVQPDGPTLDADEAHQCGGCGGMIPARNAALWSIKAYCSDACARRKEQAKGAPRGYPVSEGDFENWIESACPPPSLDNSTAESWMRKAYDAGAMVATERERDARR